MQAHPSAQAYFKSTDGHHGNWSFNLRRPNIHLLSLAASHGGYVAMNILYFYFLINNLVQRLILVDSTRAGKRLPDALSKTVPIWCAVINRAILLRGGCFDIDVDVPLLPPPSSSNVVMADTDLDLHTPPGVVSPHEHAQIAARLDTWAAALAVSSVFTCRCTSASLASIPATITMATHRTRRMHSLNWLGRCAPCGSRPLRSASRTSRLMLRSCLLYA